MDHAAAADSNVSDKDLIDSIVSQVSNDTSPLPPPVAATSSSSSALEIPVLPRKLVPRNVGVPSSAQVTTPPSSDWKDYFSLQLLKYILVATVLIFVLHQSTVLEAVKSIIPDSLPLHSYLPSLLVALLAGATIVLLQHSQLM